MARRASLAFVRNLFRPFLAFTRVEILGGTLLLVASVIALVWANSPWTATYAWLWERRISIGLDDFAVQGSLAFWINDLLMAFFFLLVGMEIKRELVLGELNTLKKAALPVVAAVGGMVVPAAIYSAFNWGQEEAMRGWGIPMATDIAFALGILRLAGHRVPAALFTFLGALAIIDDLGAILVIAFFYTEELSVSALGVAAILLVVMGIMNRLDVRRAGLYLLVGAPLWLAIYQSGIHPTIAGVLTGMMIPARRRSGELPAIVASAQSLVGLAARKDLPEEDKHAALGALEHEVRKAQAPLEAVEFTLHPYISYGVLPLFALANAGVVLLGASPSMILDPVTLGILFGLFVGKPVGVFGATWLATRVGIAQLPKGVGMQHVMGAGMLGGIGFTMALFIGGLAFDPTSLAHTEAKIGVFTGSILSGVAGLAYLYSRKPVAQPAVSALESSTRAEADR